VTTSLTIKNRQKRGLREIFNSKVAYAEFYARKSRNGKGFDHYGVVVTTTSGNRWLVHKGLGFSRNSSSVITDAKHMSERWLLMQKQKVQNVKVVDYLKAAGRDFHPVHDNAFHAVKRMMKLGRKSS